MSNIDHMKSELEMFEMMVAGFRWEFSSRHAKGKSR